MTDDNTQMWEADTWLSHMQMTDDEFDSQPMKVIPYEDNFRSFKEVPGRLRRALRLYRYTPRHAKALY